MKYVDLNPLANFIYGWATSQFGDPNLGDVQLQALNDCLLVINDAIEHNRQIESVEGVSVVLPNTIDFMYGIKEEQQ